MMRKLLLAGLALLGFVAVARADFSGPSVPGQLPGTTTNDAASAGNVGQYITGTGTTVSISSSTAADITSVSLTAGDWDVSCAVYLNPAATTNYTLAIASTGLTTNTINNGTLGAYSQTETAAVGIVVGGGTVSLPTPTFRYSFASTAPVYCDAYVVFSASTMTASAFMRARRVR